MAAFIQKLFKSRKADATPASKRATPERAASVTAEPPQTPEHERQAALLEGSLELSQLEQLAIEGATAAIRLTAAERIEDIDALQRIEKAAKSRDKGVYQHVRKRVQAHKAAQTELVQRQQAVIHLLQQAQDHAQTENTNLYEARLETLLSQWQGVQTEANTAQTTDFLTAINTCKQRLESLKAKAQAEEAQQQKHAERQATLSLLTDTLAELRQPSTERVLSLPALDALQKTQENRWLEATRDADVDKQEQKQYQQLMQTLKNLMGAVQRFDQAYAELDGLLATDEQADLAALRRTIQAVEWPADFAPPTVLAAAQKKLGSTRLEKPAAALDQSALLKELFTTLDQLEQALEQKALKPSRQLFKTAQQRVQQLAKPQAQKLQARLQLLGRQVQELQDWQGFATRPKQEALCEAMEYLAEQHMEPEAKAERIQELQQDWRALGGSTDQTLWQRFKIASDRAFEPCKAYFAARADLKKVNLHKREAICQELDAFVPALQSPGMDWKAVDKILRTARQEWKQAWPVEFKDNRDLQKQFEQLTAHIESALLNEQQRNEARKTEIVSQAEALISHEPLAEALNQAKQLQKQWQTVGITRHREDRRLWTAFRKACDTLFARRDTAKSAEQAELAALENKVKVLIAASAAARNDSQEATTLAAHKNELSALLQQTLPPTLRKPVEQELAALQASLQTQATRQRLKDWLGHAKRRSQGPLDAASLPNHWSSLQLPGAENTDFRDLVIRAEIISGQPSPVGDQERRMAIQVQRLAAGMGGNTLEPQQELEALVAHWCLNSAADAPSPELAERFCNALAT